MGADRILCAACGFSNESGVRFCGNCALPLAARASDAFRSAISYTPKHLAHRILASRGAIEGERKLVTVMFVDVRGSLEMMAGRDPEQAQSILDALLGLMIEAVHRYEGTVNQVLGDGFMAIFGAPIAHEDHAVRAACASLAIQDAVRSANEEEWEKLGIRPTVRIGLNSGVVIITAIDNDLSLDYRAVGTTTHVAARMEQIAVPGTTRLTSETLRLAEGLVDAVPLGQIAVKGVSRPVDVFELRRMTPGGTRFGARVARGLSPLVGRSAEMQILTDALNQVVGGCTRAVALHGEPGVGKSRLCYEITRATRAPSWTVLETSAVSYGRATPYAVIVTLLKRYFGIAGTEDGEELRERLRSSLCELDPDLLEHLHVVLGLLDVPGANGEWLKLDPAQRKHRTFGAVRALIERLCEKQPVLLIWEDLHWFDSESLEFLEQILRDPPNRSLLVLATDREDLPEGWHDTECVQRRLQALPPRIAEEMLRNLLGGAKELDTIRELLIARTYGNPFFIEETVRSLVESGVLVGEPGRYALGRPNPSIDIPPTAEALIAARIDALPHEVKNLVQMAAVVGQEMTVDLLRRVSGLDDEGLRALLDAATASEVMYEAHTFPSPVCGFRHALTQDVAYNGLLHAKRRALHGRVVETLEDLHRDRLAEHVELLAEHTYRGELWEKSIRYQIMAAARAVTRFANHEAVSILDRGLRIVERLPSGGSRSTSAIDLRLAGLAALLPLGDQERILSTLFEAEAIAASIDDPRRLAAIHSQLSTALWMLGQHERAREYGERALAIARDQAYFSVTLAARYNLAMAHHALGEFDRCVELTSGILDELAGGIERKRLGWAGYPSVLCRTFLASSHTFSGEFEEAARQLEIGCAMADEARHPYSRALIRHELGTYHFERGDLDLALATFEEAIEIARADEVSTMHAPLAGWLGTTLAELGRVDEAIETIETAMERGVLRLGGHYAHAFMLNGLAIAYARAGRHGEALSRAEEAVDRTLASHEFAHHGHALLRLASIQAQRGAAFFRESERRYREALDRALLQRMRPLAAECHEGLGRLYTRWRRADRARAELEVAAKMFGEIGLERRAESALVAAARP